MSKYTRRQFLEESLLAATAATLLPGIGRAAEKEKPKKKSPGDRLSVAIVGVGGRGAEHVRQFLELPDTEITYIVDADEKIGQARVEAIARVQERKPKFVKDLRTALDDPSVQLVSTATPNHWHPLVSIWSMQAGKDVYVEKPVSHDVSEGRAMVETARRYNRMCQSGMQMRSWQGVIDAVDYVKAGKIGEVKLARGLCYKPRPSIGPKGNYPIPPGVDYDLWTGPAPLLPLTRPKLHYDWHMQRAYGNGDMGNQAPHQMDICRWGLGIDRLADTAIAFGGRLGYEDAGDAANTEVGIFDFGGKTIVFEVRGLDSPPMHNANVAAIFYGTEGYVVVASFSGGAVLDPTGKSIVSGGAAFDPKGNVVKAFSGDGDHFANFVEASRARDHKLLKADILEGHLSCAHSHLANVSYYLGKPASPAEILAALKELKTNENVAECVNRTVEHLESNGVDLAKTPLALGPLLKIDGKTEQIIGNPEANALLSRPYRKPFTMERA
ncbi:MAG: Gfo/Idh/MocA family oxidoreductase [Pirellulales bacterium]|nr:Gfo/Idh/MocA family oxidoreductase [Pirellulales bacterium]